MEGQQSARKLKICTYGEFDISNPANRPLPKGCNEETVKRSIRLFNRSTGHENMSREKSVSTKPMKLKASQFRITTKDHLATIKTRKARRVRVRRKQRNRNEMEIVGEGNNRDNQHCGICILLLILPELINQRQELLFDLFKGVFSGKIDVRFETYLESKLACWHEVIFNATKYPRIPFSHTCVIRFHKKVLILILNSSKTE